MMQSHEDRFEVTPEDVAQLCQINPLAAEQLKNIALQRRMAELEQRLAEGIGEKVVPLRERQGEESE